MSNFLIEKNDLGVPPRSRGGLHPSNFAPPMPRHQTYIETRGSAHAWIFRKPPSPVEVLNDSDGEALNLSRAMINSATQARVLERYVKAVDAAKIVSIGSGDDPVTRAVQFARQIGMITPLSSANKRRRRYSLPMTLHLLTIDRAMERLRDVQLEDSSTMDLIRRYDWSRAFFLCDERGTNWDIEAGIALAGHLNSAKGKVTLITSVQPAWLKAERRWCRQETGQKIEAEEVWTNF